MDEITRKIIERNKLWQSNRDAELAKQRQSNAQNYSTGQSSHSQKKTNTSWENTYQQKQNSQKKVELEILIRRKSSLEYDCNSLQTKVSRRKAERTNLQKQRTDYLKKSQQIETAIRTEEARLSKTADDSYIGQIQTIALSIDRHRKQEQERYIRIPAVARAVSASNGTIWFTNCEPNDAYGSPLYSDGDVKSKNSAEGLKFIHFLYEGKDIGDFTNGSQWVNYSNGIRDLDVRLSSYEERYFYNSLRILLQDLEVDDYDLSILQRDKLVIIGRLAQCEKQESLLDEQIAFDTKQIERIRTQVDDLNRQISALQSEIYKNSQEEELTAARLEEERKKREEEQLLREQERLAQEQAERERKEVEERERKEAEARELENRRIEEDILSANKIIEEQKEKIKTARSFIREENSLRSQHLLDPTQEEAKRSHFFDGTPIVIEGGPGTGKTTTIIQRLKFLLSPEAFRDHSHPLSKYQVDKLLDINTIDTQWLFISPNSQLLHYLRNNMVTEGLRATGNNTKSIDKLRSEIFSSYKLSGQFRIMTYGNDDPYTPLIIDYKEALSEFEGFLVMSIKNMMLSISNINTSKCAWNHKAISIKAACKRAESINSLSDAIQLLTIIKNSEANTVGEIEKNLKEDIEKMAMSVTNEIDNKEDDVAKNVRAEVEKLFAAWEQNKAMPIDEQIDDAEDDDANRIYLDFRGSLFSKIKPIIKKLALSRYTNTEMQLTERENALFNCTRNVIEAKIASAKAFVTKQFETLKESNTHGDNLKMETTRFERIGENAWFMTTFAEACHGVGKGLLSKIPEAYKTFRKSMIELEADFYDNKLLSSIVSKKGGNRMHPDELDLLVGYINNLLRSFATKRKKEFDELKHKYVTAFKENMKHIIGIDEATDYTALDYYLIYSLRHFDFASVTLCGDIMQGLNSHGIQKWSDLSKVFGQDPTVLELRTSYRQLPTLVNMSRQMYLDDQKVEAPYKSSKESFELDPKPLCFISPDEDDKAEWIAKRIYEIYLNYDRHMPSVAIFLSKEDEASKNKFIKNLREYDEYLNAITIADCTDNRQAEGTDLVRVFYLSDVKGMEFEVAFFHNIDDVADNGDKTLIRRYLYVGISRATSHLAATFRREKGNEEVIKYFDAEADRWSV